MPSVPIIFKPGVDVQSTPALNAASWNESENIRFFQGLAQKGGGFELFTAEVAGGGRPTALWAWTSLAHIAYLGIGAQERISLFGADVTSDITPLSKLSTIPVALTTTVGSQTVIINDPVNQPLVGDWFFIRAPITVGGIILDGAYRVDTVVDPTHYTITAAQAATVAETDGGSAREFTTISGFTEVVVAMSNHGLFSGQVVFISEPVLVGGQTLFGNYIATVNSPNDYSINTPLPATAPSAFVFEHGGNMALAFLSGLIKAASATVEFYDDTATHINIAEGGEPVPYASSGTPTYAPGDVLTVIGGVGALGTVPVFTIATTRVVVVAISNVGTGGVPGPHTFRGIDGTASVLFEFTATVALDGTLTGASPVITVNGSYSANPSLTNMPILDLSGGTLIGATVNVGVWPDTLTVTTAGAMTVTPVNPAATTNSGSGRGALIDVGWGFGYAIADVLTPVGGVGTEPTFTIQSLNVVRVVIRDPGTGGSVGVHTFQGTTGTGTKYEFTQEVGGGGTLVGDPALTVNGSYTVEPTLVGDPITDLTDGTLTGATADPSLWPATVSTTTNGSMTTIPDNPAATSDSGAGHGAELNITWDYSAGSLNDLSKEYVILDNWGEFLLAVPARGPVYVWRPKDGPGTPLQNVGSAPQANLFGFIATQQQILVLAGTVNFGDDLFDPMLVRWSDVGDYTNFIPTSANQAGSFRLQLGSTIVAGLSVAGRNLIWTNLGIYTMQYQGLPFVFAFQPVGINCGLVGPQAMGTIGDVVMWMSQNQFYVVTGGGAPQPVPCSVWDEVFPNLDKANVHQVVCCTNSHFGEIAWYVPQTDGTITHAKLQVQSGNWDYTVIQPGTNLDRAAWTDQNVFGPPMGVDPEGNVYRQETTRDANGDPLVARLLSGLAMIAEGDQQYLLHHIYPDIKFDPTVPDGGVGTVWMKVYIYKDMQAPPRVKGPYPINAKTRRIPCRGRGKGLQFEFTSNDLAGWFRLGRVEYLATPDGSGG